jgi:hypothetical protein
MDRVVRLVRKARTTLARHGLRKALYAVVLKALRHHRWLKVLRAHHVEEVDARFLEAPLSYQAGFLAPGALERVARDREAGITEEFVQYAAGKGDKCYGFILNGELRAYGWYATTPTRISPELDLCFSREYIYVYKGFTHEAHRGRRLFPIGMTRALKHYRSAGYRGLLLYVDASNFDSLKSCARMGFRPFGSIFVARILGRHFVFATPGCARFGVRLEATSAPEHRDRAREGIPAGSVADRVERI